MAKPKRPAKPKSRMPNLDNATPGAIVDWLGGVRDEMKTLKKLEGYYKEGLMARIDEDEIEIEGDVYIAAITEVVQARIDGDLIKKEMGEEWWKDHCKTIEYQMIKTTKL